MVYKKKKTKNGASSEGASGWAVHTSDGAIPLVESYADVERGQTLALVLFDLVELAVRDGRAATPGSHAG